MTEEKKATVKNVKMDVEPDEVRLIAVLRAIKDLNLQSLIGPDDAGGALTLLQVVEPDLEKLENASSAGELKTYLKGFVSGLAASRIQQVPYEQD